MRGSAAASAWDALHLLEGGWEVAAIAGGSKGAVSQRRFDNARRRSAGFESLPSARRICERLGLSWSETLRVAALPPTGRARGYMTAVGETSDPGLTPSYGQVGRYGGSSGSGRSLLVSQSR
jgi:hypothetical protein